MSCILYMADQEAEEDRLNIDDLYEKKQQQDLKQLAIFNKILNRIHSRIKDTARKTTQLKYIWFIVPEYLFGEPLYSQADCIGYVVHKLETNGFQTRYIHPNALYISWAHWVPFYVRDEYKRKTGITIDELGNIADKKDARAEEEAEAAAAAAAEGNGRNGKKFASTKGFRPQNMIYKNDLFEKMGRKFA